MNSGVWLHCSCDSSAQEAAKSCFFVLLVNMRHIHSLWWVLPFKNYVFCLSKQQYPWLWVNLTRNHNTKQPLVLREDGSLAAIISNGYLVPREGTRYYWCHRLAETSQLCVCFSLLANFTSLNPAISKSYLFSRTNSCLQETIRTNQH